MLQKCAGPLVGPLFVGPLFGWTCWACLNPPPGAIEAAVRHDSQEELDPQPVKMADKWSDE